ncbi:hypothetical protein C2G38_2194743 [Gigaspora rosea]|uniref:Uncharacterized protein n=1 Tax=Gigaspora rosea TaxID=44941 RepID=A0A397V5K7_9GLOM|nr:hypothetical protein C2G38_2194743 [Gigaspora rosea]
MPSSLKAYPCFVITGSGFACDIEADDYDENIVLKFTYMHELSHKSSEPSQRLLLELFQKLLPLFQRPPSAPSQRPLPEPSQSPPPELF